MNYEITLFRLDRYYLKILKEHFVVISAEATDDLLELISKLQKAVSDKMKAIAGRTPPLKVKSRNMRQVLFFLIAHY